MLRVNIWHKNCNTDLGLMRQLLLDPQAQSQELRIKLVLHELQ